MSSRALGCRGAAKRQSPPSTPPTLPVMLRLVAQLGGSVHRARRDEPGLQTQWEGQQRLHDIMLGDTIDNEPPKIVA